MAAENEDETETETYVNGDQFDALVVGGGIMGVCIARDPVR